MNKHTTLKIWKASLAAEVIPKIKTLIFK